MDEPDYLYLPKEWRLDPREHQILSRLYEAKNGIRRRAELFILVYGNESEVSELAFNSYISRLRTKLRPYGVVVETLRGHGFRLPPNSIAIIKQASAKALKRPVSDAEAYSWHRKT